MKLALVHDLAEAVVGDLTPFCGVSKEVRISYDAIPILVKACFSFGQLTISTDFRYFFILKCEIFD